jgi:hypothetical protein
MCRPIRIVVAAVAIAYVASLPAYAASLTEQQARIGSAQFVRGPMFATDRSTRGEAANKSLEEVASHLWLGLLVVRGDTGYCGAIREPTWVFMWNTEESASWFGGYPVMVTARIGKVLDCRS